MANQEHLAKLKEGVAIWNEWRKKHPEIEPDLQGADLSQAQLQKVDLQGARLQGTILTQAHLQGADLRRARLQKASLAQAQLQGADLSEAQLQGAHLVLANMQGANLYTAQLQGTNLRGAFFDPATNLREVRLSDKKDGTAFLADVSWGGANLAVVDWSPVEMTGDEYEARQLAVGYSWSRMVPYSGMQAKEKEDATLLDASRTAVRANRQLAVALRDQGLGEEADRFAYRAQVLQRKVFWKQHDTGRWFFSLFLALVAGYGYRMGRIIFTYALAVLLFALTYYLLGLFYEPHLSFLDAVLTSVTAFHGRVFSEPFLHPGTPQLWVTAVEAVAGLIIEGVFIAMLTQRFFSR